MERKSQILISRVLTWYTVILIIPCKVVIYNIYGRRKNHFLSFKNEWAIFHSLIGNTKQTRFFFYGSHFNSHWSQIKYTAIFNNGYFVAFRMYFFALFSTKIQILSHFCLALVQKLCCDTISTNILISVIKLSPVLAH